jgi:LmbE family N-acetylglucosaminyl deacetylase
MKVYKNLAFGILLTALFQSYLGAQVRPVYDRGTTGLYQLLERINNSKSVMMIGAHPDDEDNSLLAFLSRGENARTAYLSLTRGDGGQNIIGPELGEALGVIRTEELLQARRLDGAEQFFARAYDYGFSKTLAEAKEKWDEQTLLCDAVRAIRIFRPRVVIAQFNGTPADGHGQHQFAGYIAPLAVKAAADMNQCSSAGAPWMVQKFYQRHRGSGEPRLRINTGAYNSLIGRSYFEIAMEARSQHKSQEQGVLELKGDQYSQMNLVGSEARETDIFEGIDTTIAGAARSTNNTDDLNLQKLKELQEISASALSGFEIKAPEKILPVLVNGYAASVKGEWATRNPATKAFYRDKQREFAEATKLAAGIQIDAIADREIIVPGESSFVGVRAFFAQKEGVKGSETKLELPKGWSATSAEPPGQQQQGFFRRETGDYFAYFNLIALSSGEPTVPYWLKDPRKGDLFDWTTAGQAATLPFGDGHPKAAITLEIFGTKVVFEQPIEFRFADDVRGEIRRNVEAVPRVSVELDQSLLIVPYSDKPQTRQIAMSVVNESAKPVNGTLSLNINSPTEWKYKASTSTFELKRTGERTSVSFDLTIPAKTKPGAYQIRGQASVGDSIATSTMRTIAYPHIQTHRIYQKAAADVKVFDLKITPVKVGYVMGSGDRVFDAIKQMGFDVTMISDAELASGDLSKYDTIVVGIRAYQVRPDVVANNKRLIDFASNGGTLVVQYQLPQYAQQNLTPFPAQQGPRVVDENAEVKVVHPESPVFTSPNKIGADDFAGWVQERNLYNFSTMDPKFVGLLESHDSGEPENSGGLVIAEVGRGNYVYCSFSLFRQLPAGVPGAYRLLANMVSLGARKPL